MGYRRREMRILQNVLGNIEELKDIEQEVFEEKSLDSFTVRCPMTYTVVFTGGAILFGAIFTIAFLYNLIAFHKFDWQFIVFGCVLALPCFILGHVMQRQKLDVSNENLRYTGYRGKTSNFTFEQMDRLAITEQKSFVLYVQVKKLGTVDKDFIGWKSLLLRCVRDGVPVTANSDKPFTKGRLLFASMKAMIVTFGIIGLALEVVVGGVALKALLLNQDVWEWIPGMLCVAGIFSFMIGCIAILPAQGLLQIRKQEKALNMNFSQEMKEQQICGSYIPNYTWFIRVELTHIVAFRRDYISLLGPIESTGSYNSRKMKILTISGKEISITSSPKCLEDLKNWRENGDWAEKDERTR